MSGFERPPPPAGDDFKSWAERLSDYLVRVQSRLAFSGRPSDGVPPDGGVFWSTDGFPVVSYRGEYRQILLAGDYGYFFRDTTATAPAANTAYPVEFAAPLLAEGAALGGTPSQIVMTRPGIYQLDYSVQLGSTSGTDLEITAWLRVNGVDVPRSAAYTTLHGADRIRTSSRQVLVSLAADDVVQLLWATDNTAGRLQAVAAAAPAPNAPSASLAISKVQR